MKKKVELQRWTAALTLGCVALAVGCQGVADPAAEARFLSAVGAATVTVHPPVVRSGRGKGAAPAAEAERLAAELEARGLARCESSTEPVPLDGPGRMNQVTMIREGAAALSRFVREHPPETRYVLLAEYLWGEDQTVGLHCYVVERGGTVAFAGGLNDHHPPFQPPPAPTLEACGEVLLDWLSDRWQEGPR